jgi:methyl coenzyme M reductase subunit D
MSDAMSGKDMQTLTNLYMRVCTTFREFDTDPHFNSYTKLTKAIVDYVDYRESVKQALQLETLAMIVEMGRLKNKQKNL